MTGIYMKLSRVVVARLAEDAGKLHPAVIMRGIRFHVPQIYIPCIELSLALMEREESSAYDLIKTHIEAVYAEPEPHGIGSAHGIAFISSAYQIDDVDPQAWIDLLGHLYHGALVREFVLSGHGSAMFRWSRIRRRCDLEEKELISRLNSRNEP